MVAGLALAFSSACGSPAPAAGETPKAAGPTVARSASAPVPSPSAGAANASSALAAPSNAPQVQSALRAAHAALANVQFDVQQSPAIAAPEAATRVSIKGTDPSTGFVKLDRPTKQAAGNAALAAAATLFPKATIELNVLDDAGKQILAGVKQPLGQPSVSVIQ